MLQSGSPGVLPAIASFLAADTSPEDDLHFLLVTGQLPGPRSKTVSEATAHALAVQHAKIDQRHGLPDRLWQLRMGALLQRLGRQDPEFVPALIRDPAFGHPGHGMLIAAMSGPDRAAAARKLLSIAGESSAVWSPEFADAIASALPREEFMPRLRAKADDPRLRDTVTAVMLAQADPVDRDRLLAALATTSLPALVEKIATALATKPIQSPREILAPLKALGRHAAVPATALALDRLLAAWTDREPMSKTGGE
jgi:hypothetical protein